MLHRCFFVHSLFDIRSRKALLHRNAVRAEKALAEVVMLNGSNSLRTDYRVRRRLHATGKQQRLQTALRQLLCQRNAVRHINSVLLREIGRQLLCRRAGIKKNKVVGAYQRRCIGCNRALVFNITTVFLLHIALLHRLQLTHSRSTAMHLAHLA